MNQGFTRLELVCITAILGLLGAITLPSFFNQACACKEEAPTYVNSLARSQQAFFLENGKFSNSWTALELGVPSETESYRYDVIAQERKAIAYATPKRPKLHGYVSGVFLPPSQLEAKQTSAVIVCKAQQPGPESLAPPVNFETCGSGTELYHKSAPRQIEG